MKNIVVCTTVLVETSPQALPMGAACVASALKHDENTKDKFCVLLKDFSREDDDIDAKVIAQNLIDEAKKNDGKLFAVCASVYVWNRNILEAVACELKKLDSDILCVAGGPEITADPIHIKGFDYTVVGAGECAMPELLSSLLEGKRGDEVCVQGVYVPDENGKLEDNLVRAKNPVPQSLSSPYLDGTIDPSRYGGALWELARGCPFKCAYCYESKGEKHIQYFPLERLTAELDLFAKKNIAQVFVLDPTYNADKKRALSMLNLIAKKTPNTFYYFEARAEFIDRPLAQAFASIPCCLQIGLQSADENVLAKVHRTLNKKLFTKNIGYLNESGAIFGFDLIFGLPGDTLQGFEKSIDFALSLYPNNLELFCLSVLPGTDLHEQAQSLGLKWQKNPPYQVLESTTFSAKDIEKARNLSRAVNLFYTQGRAVPWLMSVLHPLHIKPSAFFTGFAQFLMEKHLDKAGATAATASSGSVPEVLSVDEIIKLQLEYVKARYLQKKLDRLVNLASDLILLNGAVGKCTADGNSSTVQVHYHPDDLMSEYATDLVYFVQNAQNYKCKVKVFPTSQGPDWKVVK